MTITAQNVTILKKWLLLKRRNPNNGMAFIVGYCYDHSSYEDGAFIKTSEIKKIDGRFILTYSGTWYYLDDPDPKYVEILHKNGYIYDPDNPLIEG